MFKIFKKSLLALVFGGLILQGCSKDEVLELRPEFSLDAIDNPSNITQVEQVLLGAYSRFRGADYFGSGSGTGGGWAMMPDVLSDNLYETVESLANSRAMADWIYNQNIGQISGLYSAPYGVIAAANIVLRDVDKFATATNQTTVNRLKGQALAMRAFAHFNLLQYFAVNFDRNSTTELAMPYTKEFLVSSTLKPSRMNNKEYYDNIFADLNQAVTVLGSVDKPINPTTGNTRPYIDRNVAYAMQARVNLYAGQWADAVTAATNAIAARPLVSSQAAYSGMYNETNSGEMLWNIQFDAGQSGPTFLVYFATVQRSYFRPAPEVAALPGTTGLIQNNDIRYSAFFSNIGGALAVTKYRGKGALSDGNANFVVFKTGEMYLIRAEARARLGQDGPALADLNTLKAARIAGFTPIVGLTGAALLAEIADERRRELFAEGHRFFDLKRTTRAIQRGAACGSSLSVAGNCTLAPTAREWAMPIPETVRNANPNIQQNPGYN
jgi:starch-binding outer membrane protein, SusD/RagB family